MAGRVEMSTIDVELQEPGKPPRRLAVAQALEVGRECDGLVVDDPQVSRRHLRLTPTKAGLRVEDLGSANGTRINGVAILASAQAGPGDILGFGATELTVLGDRSSALSEETATAAVPKAVRPPAGALERPLNTAAVAGLEVLETNAAVVRFRRGLRPTPGPVERRGSYEEVGLFAANERLARHLHELDPFLEPFSLDLEYAWEPLGIAARVADQLPYRRHGSIDQTLLVDLRQQRPSIEDPSGEWVGRRWRALLTRPSGRPSAASLPG